jgi:hypothetical protein
VTVQACFPRWTFTTFRLGVGDHDTDVFISLAAACRRKMPSASSGVLWRARAPTVNQPRSRMSANRFFASKTAQVLLDEPLARGLQCDAKGGRTQPEEPIADQKRSATHRRACPFA